MLGILIYPRLYSSGSSYLCKMRKWGMLFGLILFLVNAVSAQNADKNGWVDSVYNTLNTKEKIAQLLMVRAYSNKGPEHEQFISDLIEKYKIGGLCFFQGGPQRQANLTTRYQSLSHVPLLIAMDAEWGLGMRLDSAYAYPFQLTLGAMENDSLVYFQGEQVARQLKSLGVHINFAPVCDINNNPDNPVINSRSFGENIDNVTRKSIMYMKGLQDHGIMATAKHFPGHGDTDSDSHHTLPLINHSPARLDSVELMPFKAMINEDLQGIMIAHLFIPELDSRDHMPTTLSENVVQKLLVDSLGFQGLKITDALDMAGVAKYFQPGEIEVMALQAGNDILLLPQDVEAAIESIQEAINRGDIDSLLLEEKCKKVLAAKYNAGLHHPDSICPDGVYGTQKDALLSLKMFRDASTILTNRDFTLPVKDITHLKLAILSIGEPQLTPFQKMMGNYMAADFYNTEKIIDPIQAKELKNNLSEYDLVVIGLHNTNIFPHRNFGIEPSSVKLIEALANPENTILALFASPYALKYFDPESFKAMILGYEDKVAAQETVAQIMMGALPAKGTLPVTVNENYHLGDGIHTTSIGRLQYSIPEDVGISTEDLLKIDSIIFYEIAEGSFPGCQVMIGKNGKVIYDKSFGYHTYKKGNFVKKTDLYDLASITKIAASTLSVMQLCDIGKLNIDERLVTYLPFVKGSNKENIILREMMAHQSRFQAWIPFYLNTMDEDGSLNKDIYTGQIQEGFTVPVAEGLFIKDDYKFTLTDTIVQSDLREKKEYKYSDLGFYLLRQIIENTTNQPFDRFVSTTFYEPLGLQHMQFNPWKNIPPKRIVPTEDDKIFRNQLIHGYVHDPGAAMLGGIGGHAGLFSNANDLAILLQLFLQGGYYGGRQYIQPSTIHEFTKQQFPLNDNRRGIGFDKPLLEDKNLGPTCSYVSDDSYGHSGFTGTYFWCDPEYDLFYIFLSNRIHPSSENRKLIQHNTRTSIQEIIYQSFMDNESNQKMSASR